MRLWAAVAPLCLLAACGGGGGGSGPTQQPQTAPQARETASGAVQMVDGTMHATLAGQVLLDASASTAPGNDTLSFAWSLVSAPVGSTLSINSTASTLAWSADVPGTYVIAVKVSDSHGASSTQQVTVVADNAAPVANIAVSTSFTAQVAQAPAQSVSVGAHIVLDATQSTDPDGDAVTVTYDVTGPTGSAASLLSIGRITRLTPDVPGRYLVRARGTDTHGASFETDYTFDADNRAPVAGIAVNATFTAAIVQQPAQDATLGATITVDATGSTDPDGDPVAVTFDLGVPNGSATRAAVAGRVARFTPDALGAYVLRVHGVDTHGASFETDYTFNADNRAPNPVTTFGVQANIADGGSATLATSVGYDVALDGGASSDADGDAISYAWSLASKPAGSNAALACAAGAARCGLSPDQLGNYVVVLILTDAHGAQTRRTLTVAANNRRPNAVVSTNATPQSLPSATGTTVPLGTVVTLNAGNSTDADGDAITYAWSIDSAPVGSHAVLSSTTAVSPSFTADVEGAYVFRLRATDTHAAYSERTVVLNVGTHAPVAVVDRTAVTVARGTPATLSGGLSFDEDGDALTWQWSIAAKPAGSTATLAGATASTLTFTPDLAGLYVLSLQVSDGHRSGSATVSVRSLASFAPSVALAYAPLVSHYSPGLDKLVVASTGPDALHVVDPFSGVQTAVSLPLPMKQSFRLSPDGRLAVVLHEAYVSLVDLTTNTLLHTSSTSGSQTDAFVTNAGVVYAIGQSGGQWVNNPITVLDGRTGALLPATGGSYGQFYGTNVGVMAPSIGRIFYMSLGLSPANIDSFTFDNAGTQPIQMGTSPYWGDYPLNVPLWMASDDSLLFTAAGTYFRSDTLRYAGTLTGLNNPFSLDDAVAQQELLALGLTYDAGGSHLPASYQRFTGPLLAPDTAMALPLVGGQQSYGLGVFHSATGRHVLLVQTGGDQSTSTGLHYAVVAR